MTSDDASSVSAQMQVPQGPTSSNAPWMAQQPRPPAAMPQLPLTTNLLTQVVPEQPARIGVGLSQPTTELFAQVGQARTMFSERPNSTRQLLQGREDHGRTTARTVARTNLGSLLSAGPNDVFGPMQPARASLFSPPTATNTGGPNGASTTVAPRQHGRTTQACT